MPTFITNNNVGLTAPITLAADDEHHALHVLRLKIGETIQVTDNQGTLATAKLRSTSPLMFDVIETRVQTKPQNLTVLLPLIDRDRLEWSIEKLTELNVNTVQLITTERTQKSALNDNQFKRLFTISESAQKQCGRAWPLTLKNSTPLKSYAFDNTAQIFFGSIETETELQTLQTEKPIVICIGPEGGFTPSEIDLLKSHKANPIHIGETILRAETAAITLATLLLYR